MKILKFTCFFFVFLCICFVIEAISSISGNDKKRDENNRIVNNYHNTSDYYIKGKIKSLKYLGWIAGRTYSYIVEIKPDSCNVRSCSTVDELCVGIYDKQRNIIYAHVTFDSDNLKKNSMITIYNNHGNSNILYPNNIKRPVHAASGEILDSLRVYENKNTIRF